MIYKVLCHLWIMFLVSTLKNSLPTKGCLLGFFPKSLTVFCLVLDSFWVNFCMRFFSFFFFAYDVPLFQYHLSKRLSFIPRIAFAPLPKSVGCICVSVSGFSALFHWLVSVSIPLPILQSHWFLWLGNNLSLPTLFFLKTVLAILVPLAFT